MSQPTALKQVATILQTQKPPCFIVLVATISDKPHIVVAMSEEVIQTWSKDAREVIKTLAVPIQGGGGGKPTLATAGGRAPEGLAQVLALAKSLLP